MPQWIANIQWDNTLVTAALTAMLTIFVNRLDRKHSQALAVKEAKAKEARALLRVAEVFEAFTADCYRKRIRIVDVAGEAQEYHDTRHLSEIKGLEFEFPDDIDWDALKPIDIAEFRSFALKYELSGSWVMDAWLYSDLDIFDAKDYECQTLMYYGTLAWGIGTSIRVRISVPEAPNYECAAALLDAMDEKVKQRANDKDMLIPELRTMVPAKERLPHAVWVRSYVRNNV